MYLTSPGVNHSPFARHWKPPEKNWRIRRKAINPSSTAIVSASLQKGRNSAVKDKGAHIRQDTGP